MPVITDFQKTKICIFFILPLIISVWIRRRRGRGILTIIGLAAAVGITDFIAAREMKPFFHRSRPEYAGVPVILREGRHGRYGFPSNHAANLFAAAGFLSEAEPILLLPVAVVGLIIGYSRVYVGAHFPLDVLAGALFGWFFGAALGRLFKRVLVRAPRPPPR
ncbi:MAG: phosphatase PAP2 family protein [Elusimicrobiota bacterium]